MNTSSSISPYFRVFQAAQVKGNNKAFLSRDITVTDLILLRGDVHHLFPKHHLKSLGLAKGRYNQIANYVLAQSEINIAIGNKAPEVYFKQLAEQCNGGKRRYGNIVDSNEMKNNFKINCVPVEMLDGKIPDYDGFLDQRRKLMAAKIKAYFQTL